MNFKNVTIIKSPILFALFIIVSVVACGPKNNSSSQPETTVDESTPALLQEMNNPVSIENQNNETETQILDLTSDETESNTSAITINPPHGEPGHRCDIAVGAPLNSQPVNEVIQTEVVQTEVETTPTVPVEANTSVAPPPTTGRVGPTIENARNFVPTQRNPYVPVNNTTTSGQSVKINPPHGQPGHRCDIAVGDPLPATANNNVKINPPHGEPGHRCDIAVGDPLPS